MIVVVGSLNLDFVATVEQLPNAGETVLSSSLLRVDGGKGGNQAVAAARLGADVAFVGAVGADDDDGDLVQSLVSEGIDVSAVSVIESEVSGVAWVTVDSSGRNTIIVSQGANRQLVLNDLARDLLAQANVVLLQLEIPLATVAESADIATGVVILNAAPAAAVPADVLEHINIVIVNEEERTMLESSGTLGENTVVVATLGHRGSSVTIDGSAHHIDAPNVSVVDTTGAGDTFCGAFAQAIDRGRGTVDAAEWATVAGSIATTRLGARTAMPSADEVYRLLAETS
ncbi:MAG: ribokinase [Acidobacteria bacterium]|nr:MAG: ribokinase [Acidobacteriota bacterium]